MAVSKVRQALAYDFYSDFIGFFAYYPIYSWIDDFMDVQIISIKTCFGGERRVSDASSLAT